MNRFLRISLSAVAGLAVLSCTPKKDEKKEDPAIGFNVTRVFPHDRTAFTQGLTIDGGRLFESTGQDASWIAEVDIVSGKQTKRIQLEKKYFGEGICILNRKIYQLTWKSHTGFIYDVKTYAKKGEFSYPYEGWGITHDGKRLIVSDGTDKIHFLDTASLKETSSISVRGASGALQNINELEYIEGYIYANQWQTPFIFKIDPATGNVVGRLDFSVIAEKMRVAYSNSDVLNGIAYERKSKLILITGKLWPNLFAIKLK